MNRIGTRLPDSKRISVFYCHISESSAHKVEIPVWAKDAHAAKLIAERKARTMAIEEMSKTLSPVSYVFIVAVEGDGFYS